MADLGKMTDEELEGLSQTEFDALFTDRLQVLVERVERLERTCAECHRAWIDESERWRSYLTIDDELALYCPDCAAREFGDDDA